MKHNNIAVAQHSLILCQANYKEGIKDFAERLKEISDVSGDIPGWRDVITNEMDIDNLVKEMVGAE